MRVIEVTDNVARQVNIDELEGDFAANLNGASPIGTRVGLKSGSHVA